MTSLLTRATTSSTTTLLFCAKHESAGAIRINPAQTYPFFNILVFCSLGILAPCFQRKQYVSDGLCDALIIAFQCDRQDAAGIKFRPFLLSHQAHEPFGADRGCRVKFDGSLIPPAIHGRYLQQLTER